MVFDERKYLNEKTLSSVASLKVKGSHSFSVWDGELTKQHHKPCALIFCDDVIKTKMKLNDWLEWFYQSCECGSKEMLSQATHKVSHLMVGVSLYFTTQKKTSLVFPDKRMHSLAPDPFVVFPMWCIRQRQYLALLKTSRANKQNSLGKHHKWG